ncbi:NAD(P)-binding protein [Aspergillus lentulus]|uniref:NAD(P)-binding protein n=1 Tax=Aspergillus lentulus TaxID=293939 RepID=UPI001393DD5B|nr:NAD(P)-binding protein [Aspergillus lentulus]GFF44590.1 NAD(P)-binding protein [Aspergillus lentulus]
MRTPKLLAPAPIDPPGKSIEFLGPAIFPAHTTPTTAFVQTSLIARSETAGKRNFSQNTPNQTDVDALLGPGPPVGLGKMQIMCWAAQNSPKDPHVSFAGKTVLLTGSNTGLGFEAAVKFAAHGG